VLVANGEPLRADLSLARPVVVLDEPFGAFGPLQLDDVLAVVRACAREGAAVILTRADRRDAEDFSKTSTPRYPCPRYTWRCVHRIR
jgi:ABC-type thiamine transport system ATPase subunit